MPTTPPHSALPEAHARAPAGAASVDALVDLLRGRRVVVLSGAGCSTESGIPDYRGPETRRRSRNPIQYRAFVDDSTARARYWARSAVGWSHVARAEPNAGHRALAAMEHAGVVCGVITQNVDGLHRAAGSRRVVALHGSLDEVTCLDCRSVDTRRAVQQRILRDNPGWARHTADVAPDGDAELPELPPGFVVPTCRACNGTLKPNVVFFGENVPRDRVASAWKLFDEAEALLVVGSSLAVYSGYRFVLRAARQAMPIAIVNLGPTRGDAHAAVRVEGRTGEVLPVMAKRVMDG